eukprot:scaffold767_cov127-Amphora_coffeaeformis.AAC.1
MTMRSTTTLLCFAALSASCVSASFDISGDYRFRLCEPVPDDRLLPLALNSYQAVSIQKTTNALDICEDAFELNWRIENHMEAKICVLDDTKVEPLVRIDKVLSTKQLPRDPHNIALEQGLKEALPLVNKISFQGDLIVLENSNGRVCVALEKIEEQETSQQDKHDNNKEEKDEH